MKSYIATQDSLISHKGEKILVDDVGKMFKPDGEYIGCFGKMNNFDLFFKEEIFFKKDDLVKCINPAGASYMEKDKIYKVHAVRDHDKQIQILIENDNDCWYFTHRFVHATDKEKSDYLLSKAKFKAGQKVRANDANTFHTILCVASNTNSNRIEYYLSEVNGFFIEKELTAYVEKPKPMLTFGGEDVIIQKTLNSDIWIKCKGQSGKYERLLELVYSIRAYKEDISKYPIRKFASVQLEKIYYFKKNYTGFLEYKVQIGCLTGTLTELVAILDECLRLKYEK